MDATPTPSSALPEEGLPVPVRLIGLNGKKGSGKNTVADLLAELGGYRQASYAALLKESAAAVFGIDPAEWEITKNDPHTTVSLNRPGKKRLILTAREFLQRYGTEAHRDVFGEEVWISALMAKIVPTLEGGTTYAIFDTRFDNELRAVRAHGGVNVRITRPDLDTDDTHSSEADPDMSLIDYVLENHGTLDDLRATVSNLLGHLQP